MGGDAKSQNQTLMEERFKSLAWAILKDDKKAFDALAAAYPDISGVRFGRFPLLSVCYLSGAYRIADAYENKLLPLFKYEDVGEIVEIERLFLEKSKKSARFYLDGKIMSPLEALAVAGDTARLKAAYGRGFKSRATQERIAAIYFSKDGRKVTFKGDGIVVPKGRLSKRAFKAVAAALCVALIATAGAGALWGAAAAAFGTGTEKNPYKIASAAQLESAASKDAFATLTSDITLLQWNPVDCRVRLSGAGHTIFSNGRIFDVLSGALSDVKFDFGQIDTAVSENEGLVTRVNDGEISGAALAARWNVEEKSAADSCYIAGFAAVNNGKISDCAADVSIAVSGDGAGDAYAASIAGLNSGAIERCSTSDTSSISSHTVDLAGIAAKNGFEGTVVDCVNRAAVSQTSEAAEWSPNCAGIAVTNDGVIEGCLNFGKIGSESVADAATEVFAAGIAAVNGGSLLKCGSDAEIVARSYKSFAYAGGVAGVNNDTGTIDNCRAFGGVSAVSTRVAAEGENKTFSFSGGIAAFFKGGVLRKNYTASTITAEGEAAYSGGAAGLVLYFVSGNMNYIIANDISENYFVKGSAAFGLGSALNSATGTVAGGLDFDGVFALDSRAELEKKGVYWG